LEIVLAVSGARRKLRSVVVVLWLTAVLPAHATEPLRVSSNRVRLERYPAASGIVTIAPGDVADASRSSSERAHAQTRSSACSGASVAACRRRCSPHGPTPRHFDYRREIGGSPYATTIDFDGTRAHGIYLHGGSRQEVDLAADVVDPVTAVFRARGSDAGPGDALWYDVWTGEVRYLVRLDIAASEPVDVPAGRFAALKVVRTCGGSKVGRRRTRACARDDWVTDDPRHVPLRSAARSSSAP